MVKGAAILAAAVVACGCAAEEVAGRVSPVTPLTPLSPVTPVSPETTVPVLLSPGEGAVVDNGCGDSSDPMEWTFDWSEVPRAERYHVYVMGRTARIPAVDAEVAGSFYSKRSNAYVADQNRLGWRWKVRAFVDGTWREFTPERSFDVEILDTDCPR